MARSRALRWTEMLLWWTGALLLGWCVATLAESRIYQTFAGRSLDRMRQARPAESSAPLPPAAETREPAPAPRAEPKEPAPAPGSLIGRLEVPRLGLSAIVLEGDDPRALRLGIGHVPGTPFPWENGNAALAGHRDTFLRPLRNIRGGDEVDVATPTETYHYIVESVQIVTPDDVSVLAPSPSPSLTLVTCYPFYFVGNAPKRFVVRARRVDG